MLHFNFRDGSKVSNKGNAVLYGMNLRDKNVDISLGAPYGIFPKDVYTLTAHGKEINST